MFSPVAVAVAVVESLAAVGGAVAVCRAFASAALQQTLGPPHDNLHVAVLPLCLRPARVEFVGRRQSFPLAIVAESVVPELPGRVPK